LLVRNRAHGRRRPERRPGLRRGVNLRR
jgi:hypothetical protein